MNKNFNSIFDLHQVKNFTFFLIFQGKLTNKEASEKSYVLASEIYKAEQKELILEENPLFNPELLEQVLSEIICVFIHNLW